MNWLPRQWIPGNQKAKLYSYNTIDVHTLFIYYVPHKSSVIAYNLSICKLMCYRYHSMSYVEYNQMLFFKYWVTCLSDVAIQSHPVSPPPTIRTSLSLALSLRWSMLSPDCFFCHVSRKDMAKWMPFNSWPEHEEQENIDQRINQMVCIHMSNFLPRGGKFDISSIFDLPNLFGH